MKVDMPLNKETNEMSAWNTKQNLIKNIHRDFMTCKFYIMFKKKKKKKRRERECWVYTK